MSRTDRFSRFFWTLLAALIWAVVGGVTAYIYAPTTTTLVSSSIGGFTGVWLGTRLSVSKWKLLGLYLIGLLWWGAASLAVWGLGRFDLAAQLLGPSHAFELAVALKFLVFTFILSTLLRASSIRKSQFLVFEGCLLAFLVAKLFSGHRQGQIDRPYFLVDPLWSQGFDPLPAFMAIGATVALLTVVLASSGVANKRAMRDLCLAALAIGALYLITPIQSLTNLPKPPEFLSSVGQKPVKPARYAESDSPNFDDRERNRKNAPLALVLFETDYTPFTETYYFRERAYSRIQEDHLVAEKTVKFDSDISDRFPADTVELEQEPVRDRMGEYVTTTVCLISEFSRPMVLDQGLELSPSVNPDPSRFRTSYKVKSWGVDFPEEFFFTAKVGSPSWDEATWEHYLKMPANPKYQELADQVLEIYPQTKDHMVLRAFACSIWLGDQGTYCFRTKHSKAPDPVASFLFGDRTGYCVYFAHAACFLYRGMGVPARVVGGYAVPAENRANGPALLVGSSYGHAWPEIYIEGVGWYPVDVTPAATLEEPIVPPDSNLQQLLGEMAKNMESDLQLPGLAPKRKLQDVALNGLSTLMTTLPPILLIIFLLLHLAKGRQSWLARRGDRRHVTAYRALLQRLAEYGLTRRIGETRTEFSQRVGALCPSLDEMTYIHLKHTLGHNRTETQDKVLTDLYLKASNELKQEQPVWRRLLATLDPWSWSKAR